MARVALLIGTGEYTEGFKPLPAAPKDVEAIADVLRDSEMGGFDRVNTLINEPYTTIAETIETWFREHGRDDLALLYISGHGVKDARSDLYFAAFNTRKQKEELVRATAVSASFVRDRIRESKAKRQIIILDCCFSGAFGDLLSKDDDTINLEALLSAEGRVVLTSSSSIQYSFEQRDGSLSIYTRYLVEGIRTGAADVDGDGAISVQELHDYAKRKVQEESPAMTPKIIVLKDEGYQIRIAKAPLGDPKVKYRKEVEAIVQEDGDEIDEILSRPLLEEWQRKLNLTDELVQTIEAEILEPIRQRQVKIQRYREVFQRAIQHNNPLGKRERKRLKQLQQVLGLLDENVQAIESEIRSESLDMLEGNLIRKIQLLKDEIGFLSGKESQAIRDYDLNLVAEIKYNRIAKLELELQPLEAELARRKPASDSTQKAKASSLKDSKRSNRSSGAIENLSSEKGIDYTRLRDLLRAGDWKAADEETLFRMQEVVGKKGKWVSDQDLFNFPETDLKTIDQLWITYSNGHFGFSVQKQIYVECGATLNGKYPGREIWEKFGDRVGWRKDGKWLDYNNLDPSLACPKGSFPAILRGNGMKGGRGSLLSHKDL